MDSPASPPVDTRPRLARAAGLIAVAVAAAGVAGIAVSPRPAVAFSASSSAMADGEVTTTDGRTFEGDVTEQGDEVVIDRNGIVTRLARADVSRIDYGTPEERLRKRLDSIGENNTTDRLSVAEEAIRRGLLDMADEIVEGVLEQNPGDRRADSLATRIERQRSLDEASGQGSRRPGADRRRPGRPDRGEPDVNNDRRRGGPARPQLGDLLTESQINRVRLAELQSADAFSGRPPRIRFEDRVVQRFVETQPNLEFRQFNEANDVEKALYLLANAPEEAMVDDVVLATDPGSLATFRQNIHAAVLETCATAECHGGRDPLGGLLLYDGRNDETIYTNFVTLSLSEATVDDPSGGAFGGDGTLVRKMIDRDEPDSSLLLQYLLPADQVRYPHPTVEGFRPRFQNPNDQWFQGVRNWIGGELKRPRSDYRIDFTPPGQSPATRPATRAAEGDQR